MVSRNRWFLLLINSVMVICFVMTVMMIAGCTGDDDDDDNDNNDNDSWSDNIVIGDGTRSEVWFDYLTDPDPHNYHKYGVYSNRLMAVAHPEVYLLGDLLFITNVEGRELQPRYGLPSTFFFYMEDIDFNLYNIIHTTDFYPPDVTLFPYLDRRCLAAKSTLLKCEGVGFPKQQTHIKEIEKAILYYYNIRQNDPEAAVYLIYCESEASYVWRDSLIYSMNDDSIVDPIQLDTEKIILIFNERNVWYPLMVRDDTDIDPTLSIVVDRFGSYELPSLTIVEEYFLTFLKEISQLHTDQEILLASLLAGKCNYSYGVLKDDAHWVDGMDAIWQSAIPNMNQEDLISMLGWYTYGSIDAMLTKQIILESNILSPYAYYLASFLPDNYLIRDLVKLSSKYYNCGFYGGLVWELGFDTYNMDESLLCRAGVCDILAMNIASVLNVKGINNYLYMGYRGIMQYAHTLVYIPKFGSFFSNAHHVSMGSIFYGPEFPNALFYINHNGEWSGFILESYYGSVEPSITADWYEFLYEQYYETIYGNSRQNGESVDVSYTDFTTALRSQTYQENSVIMTLP